MAFGHRMFDNFVSAFSVVAVSYMLAAAWVKYISSEKA